MTPSFASQPPPHTQCAMGTYTTSSHSAENHNTAEKRMRSAKPPITSAGVITAKVIWNMKYTLSGTVPDTESHVTPARNALSKLPMKPCAEPPSVNVSE